MTHEERQELRELFDDKLSPLIAKLKEHHETLYGNGGDGIKVEVDRLTEEHKRVEKSKTGLLTLWVGAVLAGIGGIINLALALFN